MEETCHNCNSKDIFFDGELCRCLNCHYMWVPKVTPPDTQSQGNETEKPERDNEEET